MFPVSIEYVHVDATQSNLHDVKRKWHGERNAQWTSLSLKRKIIACLRSYLSSTAEQNRRAPTNRPGSAHPSRKKLHPISLEAAFFSIDLIMMMTGLEGFRIYFEIWCEVAGAPVLMVVHEPSALFLSVVASIVAHERTKDDPLLHAHGRPLLRSSPLLPPLMPSHLVDSLSYQLSSESTKRHTEAPRSQPQPEDRGKGFVFDDDRHGKP